MKILLITEGLGSGGAERQLCGLANLITKRGVQCLLITYGHEKYFEPYLKEQGVNYEYHPELLPRYTRVFRLIKILYKYRPTTIISYLPSVNISTCLARLFYRCNLVVSDRSNCAAVSGKKYIQYLLYSIAQWVVPNSYSQANFITTHFPWLKRIVPIVNFVDINRFEPIEDKRESDIFIILTVARYVPVKNCLRYLEAIRLVTNKNRKVRFIWYGDKTCDSKYYSLVESKVLELGINKYVSLNDATGAIELEYQKADAFILPSILEGYPNALVEAMSSGLPVICSNVYDNPYIVKEGENGFLFNPYDSANMADAIEHLINLSKEELNEISVRNRKLCVYRNSEEGFVDSYLDICK